MFIENFVIYISFRCHDVPYVLTFAGSMMLYNIIYDMIYKCIIAIICILYNRFKY